MGPQHIEGDGHHITLLPLDDESRVMLSVEISTNVAKTPDLIAALKLTPANAAWLGGLLTRAARGMVV